MQALAGEHQWVTRGWGLAGGAKVTQPGPRCPPKELALARLTQSSLTPQKTKLSESLS